MLTAPVTHNERRAPAFHGAPHQHAPRFPHGAGRVLPPSLPPPLCAAFTSFVAFPQVSMAGSSCDPMAVDSTAEENLLDKLVRGPSARAQ